MKEKNRYIFTFVLILILIVAFSSLSFAGAKDSSAYSKISFNMGGVMSVSFRGDSANYPENSIEAVESAFKIGADMVSVNVAKTSDGVLVLCDAANLNNACQTQFSDVSKITYEELSDLKMYDTSGKITKYNVTTLEKAMKKIPDDKMLIIDDAWNFRDEIYALAVSKKSVNKIAIRAGVSSKEISSWSTSNEEPMVVIGVYDGNVIFNAISHVNNLARAGMPAVQYESKNYFNVMYGSLVCKKFGENGIARAIAPMYDADKCGQRQDSQSGWDDLISKGFSVIETNNISQFVSYVNSIEVVKENLIDLLEKSDDVDNSLYSQVSAKNLTDSQNQARGLLGINSSLAQLQQSYSSLLSSMDNLAFKDGQDTQKGNLNVTAGKIIAVVVVGAALLLGQIYMHKKKQKSNR